MILQAKPRLIQVCRSGASALIFCVAVIGAEAAPISASDEIVEAMIDAQTANVTYLIRAFGSSQPPNLGVSFTSHTDLASKSFNFVADAGSIFNSSVLSLSVNGAYSGTTNQWEMTSAGFFGGNAFSGTGSMAFNLNPSDPLIAAGASGSWLWGLFDYRSTVKISNLSGTRSAGDIIFTILGDDVGTATVTDALRPVEGDPNDPNSYKWDWTIKDFHLGGPTAVTPGVAPSGYLVATGQLNTRTGNGTFQVNTVAEPGMLSLFGIAALVLLALKVNAAHKKVKLSVNKYLPWQGASTWEMGRLAGTSNCPSTG